MEKHQFSIPCPRCHAERSSPLRQILSGAIAVADGIDPLEEEPEPEERPHCSRCDGEGEIPVLRCPRKLIANTSIPEFIASYHDWKKDGTLPVGTSRSEQSLSWIVARNLFDRWVEDTMKILREAEGKKAQSEARARQNRAR